MCNFTMIMQPHFNTNCARVAVKELVGEGKKYIFITCSPFYNGVYEWTKDESKEYDIWYNNKLACYCVPMDELKMVQKLEDIKQESFRKMVREQQEKWVKGEIKNHRMQKNQKPDWLLEV